MNAHNQPAKASLLTVGNGQHQDVLSRENYNEQFILVSPNKCWRKTCDGILEVLGHLIHKQLEICIAGVISKSNQQEQLI